MNPIEKIKEYLTDKYNDFNDIDDTKSMEIIADVYYFVEEVETYYSHWRRCKCQDSGTVHEHCHGTRCRKVLEGP